MTYKKCSFHLFHGKQPLNLYARFLISHSNNITVYSKFFTAVIHYILVATQFTDPERMVACVKLESAASGSWRQRLECVNTVPPAYIYRLTAI